MTDNYYAQSDRRPNTLTVGELIVRLKAFDPSEPVIFRSPYNGAFGPNTAYSVDGAKAEVLERREVPHPACTYQDEETGDEVVEEAWTDVFHAWSGVVIS